MIKKLVAPFLIVFMVAACGTAGGEAPETPRQKLAAAELSYQTVVNTVSGLIDQGVIKPGSTTANRVTTALTTARSALDAWQADPDNTTTARTATIALGALQTVLVAVQAEVTKQ